MKHKKYFIPVGVFLLGLIYVHGHAPVVLPSISSVYEGRECTTTQGNLMHMNIPNHPTRIASFGAGINEIVLTVTEPKQSILIGSVILNTPDLGKEVPIKASLTAENVLKANPDVVIVPQWASAAIINQINQMGIPVITVPTPTDFEQIESNIMLIGTALHQCEKAKAIVSNMNDVLAKAQEVSYKGRRGRSKKVAVYVSETGAIGGQGTTVNSIMEAAGLINGVSRAGVVGINTLPKEAVIAMNPDVIILSDDVYYDGQHTSQLKDKILQDPAYAHVKAVETGAIYVVDGRLLASTSQFAALAALDIAQKVYGSDN